MSDIQIHMARKIVSLLIEEINGLERVPPTLRALRYELRDAAEDFDRYNPHEYEGWE